MIQLNAFNNKTSICRLDCDSFTLLVKNKKQGQKEVDDLLSHSQFTYALEAKLRRLVSYSKRSYSMESDEKSVIKACGFSVTYAQRKAVDFNQRLAILKSSNINSNMCCQHCYYIKEPEVHFDLSLIHI